MRHDNTSDNTQKWRDPRDKYFFYTSLAIVALLVVINIAAKFAGN